MNVLWISLYPPLPLNFGGPVGIYHRLVEISKENRIFLFYINDDNDETYDMRLKEYCVDVHSYRRNKVVSFDVLKNIIRYPYTVATRNILSMKKDIQTCIDNNKIDLINVEFPQMVVNLIGVKKDGIPVILHEHNNEWNRFFQMSETVSGLKKILYRRESKLLHKFEKNIEKNKLIDNYTFLSLSDLNEMKKEFHIDKNRLHMVPLGANISQLCNKEHNGVNLMFCAAMDSELNEEAAIWFLENIWSQIFSNNIRFYLVGRNPSEKILRYSCKNIIVTGTVENLEDYYSIADIIVIPLLHGGGVKVKLLEAVGFQKCIVTTSIGVEGTKFNKETGVLVSDDPNIFAMYCNKLIRDVNFREECCKKAVEYLKNNYSWNKIGNDYRALMYSIYKDNL